MILRFDLKLRLKFNFTFRLQLQLKIPEILKSWNFTPNDGTRKVQNSQLPRYSHFFYQRLQE